MQIAPLSVSYLANLVPQPTPSNNTLTTMAPDEDVEFDDEFLFLDGEDDDFIHNNFIGDENDDILESIFQNLASLNTDSNTEY